MQVGTLPYKGQTVIEVFLRIFGDRGETEECPLIVLSTQLVILNQSGQH